MKKEGKKKKSSKIKTLAPFKPKVGSVTGREKPDIPSGYTNPSPKKTTKVVEPTHFVYWFLLTKQS